MDFMLHGILLSKTHSIFTKIIDSSICSANSHLLAFGHEIKSSFRKVQSCLQVQDQTTTSEKVNGTDY